MTRPLTTHVERAQRARRRREAKARSEMYKLLKTIPLDQLTPEQVRQRFYYDERGDRLYWRSVRGKLTPAGDGLVVRSAGREYLLSEIVQMCLAAKIERKPRDTSGEMRVMQISSITKQMAAERKARTLEFTAARRAKEPKPKEQLPVPIFSAPPYQASEQTAEELMAIARKIKEQN